MPQENKMSTVAPRDFIRVFPIGPFTWDVSRSYLLVIDGSYRNTLLRHKDVRYHGFIIAISHIGHLKPTAHAVSVCTVGAASGQRGPLGELIIEYHRLDKRSHSPSQKGFWWSHLLLLAAKIFISWDKTFQNTELRMIDRFDLIVVLYGLSIFITLRSKIGFHWQASAWQIFVWGFLSRLLYFINLHLQ